MIVKGVPMWFKEYRDYPIDSPLIKERVETNHGIIGCEMHEFNGWGNTFHETATPKKSLIRRFIHLFRRRS